MMNPGIMTSEKGDILLYCLDQLSKNKELREKWNNTISLPADATSVVIQKRIVTFFIKSKQQMVRETLQLKTNKKSVAIRQEICHPTAAKQKSEEVINLRSGCLASNNIGSFLKSIVNHPHSKQVEILSQLQNKELAKILKSLGKPSLLGKKKSKQTETLLHTIQT